MELRAQRGTQCGRLRRKCLQYAPRARRVGDGKAVVSEGKGVGRRGGGGAPKADRGTSALVRASRVFPPAERRGQMAAQRRNDEKQ